MLTGARSLGPQRPGAAELGRGAARGRAVAELSPRSAAASAVPAIPSRGRQPLWASLRPGGDVGPQPATADPLICFPRSSRSGSSPRRGTCPSDLCRRGTVCASRWGRPSQVRLASDRRRFACCPCHCIRAGVTSGLTHARVWAPFRSRAGDQQTRGRQTYNHTADGRRPVVRGDSASPRPGLLPASRPLTFPERPRGGGLKAPEQAKGGGDVWGRGE